MKKRKSNAFGKDIYLLCKDTQGKNVWLEAASWDCNWYWGFGYIETYTNNKNPHLAKDIESHSHWDTSVVGPHDGVYIHHINESPIFEETVLSDKESWKLSEFIETATTLKESAEVFGRGGSHLTNDDIEKTVVRREHYAKEINEVILPKLFSMIYELLSP